MPIEEQFFPIGSYPKYNIDPKIDAWALGIIGILVLMGSIYCILQWRKSGSTLPLIVLVGSLTTITLEPYFDVLGAVVHPDDGAVDGVNLLGRQMPLYNALIYIFYWSGTVVYVVDQIERGITLNRWIALSAILMTSAFIFELIPIYFGMWKYYNTQPLQVGGFPLWWAFVNTHAAMGISVACYYLYRLLGPCKAWLIAFVYPGLLFGIHTFAAYPGYAAISTTSRYWTALLGTVLAMVYSWIFIWLYGLAISGRQKITQD